MFFVLATLFLFIDLFAALRHAPHAFARGAPHRLVPSVVLWGSVLLGGSACLFVLADTLLNSWTPTLTNATWTLSLAGVLVVILFALAIGSMLATSEAAWQQWREEVPAASGGLAPGSASPRGLEGPTQPLPPTPGLPPASHPSRRRNQP
jgi:hypothetical protein